MKADDTFEPSFEMTILIRRIIWDIWIIQMIQIILVIILIMLLIIRIILFCDHMDYISGKKITFIISLIPKNIICIIQNVIVQIILLIIGIIFFGDCFDYIFFEFHLLHCMDYVIIRILWIFTYNSYNHFIIKV